jgi:hypothetical protein
MGRVAPTLLFMSAPLEAAHAQANELGRMHMNQCHPRVPAYKR